MKIYQTVFNLQSGHEYMVIMALFNVQRAITQRVGKPELRFMCTALCLIVLYICVKFRANIKNSIRVIEQIRVHGRNGYVECSKGNNSKVGKPELRFICSAHRLMVFYIRVKFREKYLKQYQSYGADTKL